MNKCLAYLAVACISVASCKSVSQYAIDKSKVKIDPKMIGIWRVREDTDKHNFIVIERRDDYRYAVTYMDRGGMNPTFENFDAFESDIKNMRFINVSWGSYMDTYLKLPKTAFERGYFFLKLSDNREDGLEMTLTQFKDSTLQTTNGSEETKQHIAKNMNNPAFYEKPLHLYKALRLQYCR